MTNYFGATPVILADDTSGGNVSGAKPVYLVNANGTPASLSATVGAAARPVPTYAAPRANSFDPRTSMYNGLGKLLNFRAKLGLAATGTGVCRIGVVGDSTAIGYQIEPKYSWPNILQQSILPALGYPSAGESAYCQPAGTVADSRMTYTGTGVPTTGGALGRNMTAAGSVQFTSTVAGTIAEFQLLGETGTSTISIDGATPGSVTIVSGGSGVSYSAGTLTMTTSTFTHVLLQVTGLSNTTHTLKVTWASGQVQTERFAVTNSSGVMVDNMGISGSRTVDWIGGPNYRDTFYSPGNFGQSPLFDLLITGLGINDANGSSGTFAATAIATYTSNLATIATGNSPGYTGPSTADKLLIAAWYNSANPTAATWEPYVTANYSVADTAGITLLDLSARYTSAPPSAMFVDGVHPNRAGAYRIASDIGRAITA